MQAITGFQITADQRHGYEFDLTHGHPYRSLFDDEKAAVDSIGVYLHRPVDIRKAVQYQQEFVEAFMSMSGQEPHPDEGQFVYPSASQSLLAAAMTLGHNRQPKDGAQLRAQFVSPAFDNIPGLFRSQGFRTHFTQEEPNFWVPRNYNDDVPEFEDSVRNSDILVLVTPNNPTGFQLGPDDLKTIAQLCAEAKTALCIDRTFLNLPQGYAYNMHDILADSGTSYTIVDDTGKLWATQELKLSVLTTSPDLRETALATHNLLQLTASPAVMSALAELALRGGALPEIRKLISDNRETLLEAVSSNEVFESRSAQGPFSGISVERIRLKGYEVESVVNALGKLGVGVISVTGFQGNVPSWAIGNLGMLPRMRYIRAALSRDPSYIAGAAERIAQLKPEDCSPLVNTGRP